MRDIRTADCTIIFDDSREVRDAVFSRLITWYTEHQAFDGESIQQSDEPIITAPMVLSDIADEIIKFEQHWV